MEFNEEAAKDHPYQPMDLYDLHRPTLRLNVPSFKGRDQLR